LRDGVQARARTASEDDAFAMGHGGVFGWQVGYRSPARCLQTSRPRRLAQLRHIN
jgi:hypothetical protein